MAEQIPLPIIAGPTACGKTRMAIQFAQNCRGEIVGADSRQVYKYLDIGTAKPTAQDRALVPHHLVDFVELDQNYTVADYVNDASLKIQELHGKKLLPVVCGGTGLYIRRLILGIFSVPDINPQLRLQLEQKAREQGVDSLYETLKTVDPDAAAYIHKNDRMRIIRAMEIFMGTGSPITSLKKSCTIPLVSVAPMFFVLTKTRYKLYRDIHDRVDRMVQTGLVEEVEKILRMGYDFSAKSLSGLGYGDIAAALQHKISMDHAIEKVNHLRFAIGQ